MGIPIDIDGLMRTINFEVIKILDNVDLYHTLFGIYYVFDNQVITNLNNKQMIFEVGEF